MKDSLRVYWTSWANGNIHSAQRLVDECPELNLLTTTPQSKSGIGDNNCSKHTLLTCEAVCQLADCLQSHLRRTLRFAALLHDVGKPLCMVEAAKGIIAFPNHNRISSAYARIILDKYAGIHVKERELIVSLIKNQDLPITLIQNNKPVMELHKLSQECNLELLYYLAKASLMGKRSIGLRERFEELEEFKNWCIYHNLWGEKTWEGILGFRHYRRHGTNAQTAKSIINWFYMTGLIETPTQAQRWLSKYKNWKWGTLFMTVGPPYSGKSNWLKTNYDSLPRIELKEVQNLLIQANKRPPSLDELHYNICCSIEKYLKDGRQVIFDSTNLSFENRKKIIDLSRYLGAQVVVIFFATNYNSCLTRLSNKLNENEAKEELNEYYLNFDYVAPYEYDKIIYVE